MTLSDWAKQIGSEIKQACDEAYAKGFAEAREMGEKEAEYCPDESYGDNCHTSIPRRIHAIQPKRKPT